MLCVSQCVRICPNSRCWRAATLSLMQVSVFVFSLFAPLARSPVCFFYLLSFLLSSGPNITFLFIDALVRTWPLPPPPQGRSVYRATCPAFWTPTTTVVGASPGSAESTLQDFRQFHRTHRHLPRDAKTTATTKPAIASSKCLDCAGLSPRLLYAASAY